LRATGKSAVRVKLFSLAFGFVGVARISFPAGSGKVTINRASRELEKPLGDNPFS
jgi:hypothetical protein